jgi:geranylgeranyl reductase
MKDFYDVVIIGAGPAGLSCAIELQNSGKSVLVLEKNKTIGPKICAGGITSKIKELGIPIDIANKLFSSVKINLVGKEIKISSKDPIVGMIDREVLGKYLLSKIGNSVDIVSDLEVTAVNSDHIMTSRGEIKFKKLVGADGSNSIVRRYLGLKNYRMAVAIQYVIPNEFKEVEICVDGKFFKDCYAWIFPHKGYTAIGCGHDVRRIKAPKLKENFEIWLKKKNIDVSGCDLQGGVINFDYRGYNFGNIFLAGDAAGFTSGLTGEGIYSAMVSGKEIAKKIIDPNYTCPEIKRVLKIKAIHERARRIIAFFGAMGPKIQNMFFNIVVFMFRFKRLKGKSMEYYS